MTGFRDWLASQRTDKNPFETGITAADLVARIASHHGGWQTAEELHRLLHLRGDAWLCDALADARDEYAAREAS